MWRNEKLEKRATMYPKILVSSSASILSLFTKCKCSSKLSFFGLICVLFFRWSTPDNTSKTFSSSVQIFIFIWLSNLSRLSDLSGIYMTDKLQPCQSRRKSFFESLWKHLTAKKSNITSIFRLCPINALLEKEIYPFIFLFK